MSARIRTFLFICIALAVLLAGVQASAMKLTLPSSVQSIETEAFYGDMSLDEVILPEGIRTIGARAFADSSVTLIHLPESLTFIASDAFSGCADIHAEVIEGSYAQLFCEARNIPYRITRPVTAIELNKTSLHLYFYKDSAEEGTPWSDSTFTLTATVSPANATNSSITWASSNPSIASVTQEGVVTAVSKGSAIITAKTIDGGKTAQCTVTVSDAILRFITQPKDTAVERGKTAVFSVEAALADEFMWQRRVGNSGAWSAFSFGTTSGRVNTLSLAGTDENASYQYRCRISDENGFTVFSDPVRITINNIPVSDVIIDKTSIELSKGSSATLTVNILPADASDTIIHWSSDNEHVAEISPSQTDSASASVVINAMHQGYASITATAENGSTATCEVTVVTHYINPTYTAMAVNSSKTFTSSIYPETLYNIGAAWTSSDPELVRVDTPNTNARYPEVTITALKPGTAVITGTTDVAGAQCTYEVTAVQTMLDKQTATLQAGDSFKFIASVSPSSYRGTPIDVIWNSSDPAVASVDENGTVTALKVGTTQITATSSAGSAMDVCTVTVEPRFKVTKGGGPRVSSLNITTNESWTATTDADWLLLGLTEGTYDKKSVSATGDAKLYVLLDYLPVSLASRTGDIVISYGSYRYTYTFTQKRTDVPMTGVKLSSGTNTDITATLVAGETMTLVPTFVPYYATDRRVTYSSDKTAVATVDANGKITAKAAGTAIITVKTTDGGFTAKCSVTVTPVKVWTVGTGGAVCKSIHVQSSSDWTATTSDSWLTLAPTTTPTTLKTVSGKAGNDVLVYAYLEYLPTTIESRTGKITFTNSAGSFDFTFQQKRTDVPVTGISLKASTTIHKGSTETLTPTFAPVYATDRRLTWTSSNTTVATVDAVGKVTAKAAGTATITVTTVDGNKAASCIVTVVIPVTKITLTTAVTLGESKTTTVTLTPTFTPSDATNKAVTWKSSNTSVATVSSTGVVTAVAAGTANITATAKDGSGVVSNACKITVLAKARITKQPVNLKSSAKAITDMVLGKIEKKTFTFSVEATGVSAYQWEKRLPEGSWSEISGETQAAYTPALNSVFALSIVKNTQYRCKITGQDGGGVYTNTVSVIQLVGEITITPENPEVTAGKTITLTGTVDAPYAQNTAVKWTSGNTAVATVNATTGVVSGVKAGTAVITCTAEDGGGAKATVTVTVKPATVLVTGLTLNDLQLIRHDVDVSGTISYSVTPSNASNKTLEWSSSNTNVVTVDSNGNVKGKAPGTATITAKTKDGSNITKTCKVTVTQLTTNLALNKTEMTLTVGGSDTLTVTVSPSNASNKTVSWGSTLNTIATVDQNGRVTAKAAGTAYISVSADDGGSPQVRCKVTVIAAPAATLPNDLVQVLENTSYVVAHSVPYTNCHVFTDSSLSTNGNAVDGAYYAYTEPNDEVRIYSIGSNSSGAAYAEVTYPAGETYKKAYMKLSDLVPGTGVAGARTALKSKDVKDRPGGTAYGTVSSGDTVYTLSSQDGSYQVMYPVGDGTTCWKIGWLSSSDYNQLFTDASPTPTPSGNYNASGAVKYANRHYENYNTNYTSYKGAGGDCANFVSQCLSEGGGLPWEKGIWQPDTNDTDHFDPGHTFSWVNVGGLVDYLTQLPFIEYQRNPSFASVSPGDVLVWSDLSHVTLLVEVGSNYFKDAGHTEDAIYTRYKFENSTGTKLYVIHFK